MSSPTSSPPAHHPQVYQELRRVARKLLRAEPYDHTLESCELVHRAYERILLGDLRNVSLDDPRSVVRLAITNMRRELIDHARRRRSKKRPTGRIRVTFEDVPLWVERDPSTLLAVDELLERLASPEQADRIRNGERKAMVARYALYGGLTEAEITALTDIPKSTVGRDIRFVKAWLSTHLTDESA